MGSKEGVPACKTGGDMVGRLLSRGLLLSVATW
jgi:hypothetical protein